MPREKVAFTPNVPVPVALKYPVGKIVSGTYGEQVYYTTSDDRAMYLDLHVGQMVNELGPKPGELLVITKKWSGRKGDQVNWTVERAQPELPKPDPGDQLQEQLYGSVLVARARKVGEQGDGTFAISSGANALAPRPNGRAEASVSAPAPARAASQQPPNTSHSNADAILAESCQLVDIYAQAWKYARSNYPGEVKPEEVRSMVLTAYIQQSKGGSYAR